MRAVEVFRMRGESEDYFECGWCYMSLSTFEQCSNHVQEHFDTLDQLHEESKMVMTFTPKEENGPGRDSE